MYEMLNELLTPLLQRIFSSLSEPVTGTDDQVQLTDLRREFLNFTLTILNNDLGQVLVSEGMLTTRRRRLTLLTHPRSKPEPV
jgi:exportin-T